MGLNILDDRSTSFECPSVNSSTSLSQAIETIKERTMKETTSYESKIFSALDTVLEQFTEKDEEICAVRHGVDKSPQDRSSRSFVVLELKKRRPDNGTWVSATRNFYLHHASTTSNFEAIVLRLREEVESKKDFREASSRLESLKIWEAYIGYAKGS